MVLISFRTRRGTVDDHLTLAVGNAMLSARLVDLCVVHCVGTWEVTFTRLAGGPTPETRLQQRHVI